MYKFELGNVSATAVGVSDAGVPRVYVAQRPKENAPGPSADPILVFTSSGKFVTSFGKGVVGAAHGLKMTSLGGEQKLWVTDVSNHQIMRLNAADGDVEKTLGTAGSAGSAIRPTLQFGNVADIAVDGRNNLFVADGDGGVNDRIVKLDKHLDVQWVLDHDLDSPHSITYEEKTDLLWVADRGNNRTRMYDAKTGTYKGQWTCMRYIHKSTVILTPWAVRIDNKREELIMAAATADGAHGYLLVLPLWGKSDSPRECKIEQKIYIGATDKPHELSVDEYNGDVFLANIGTPSSLMKFSRERFTSLD